jgi:hypothetical protein
MHGSIFFGPTQLVLSFSQIDLEELAFWESTIDLIP